MNFSGPDFLKKRFDLHAKPETEAAAKRKALRTGEKAQKPGEKIQAYLDRFKEITESTNEDKKRLGLKALKKLLAKTYVIKAEDIPDSYFKLQQQIARERGVELSITPELRQEAVKVIQADQRASLNEWVQYLASGDALYPDWAKYWAFRSLVGMSLYDKEKMQFGTRSKHTTARFPDLNREALAYAVDYVIKEAKGEAIKNPVKEGRNDNARDGKVVSDEEFEHLLSTENFARYYAFAIEHLVSNNEELFKITEGEWRLFPKGSEPRELTKMLQGRGTGWCTAGDETAAQTLREGDFHVFFSNNALGAPVIPRLAIRMYRDSIDEVRGVAHKQEVDPYALPVLEAKMTEFGEQGEEYKKKAKDMALVTALARKQEAGEEFTRAELRFIYEVDESIAGFGYERDPRIREIISKRDRLTDIREALGKKGDDNAFMLEFLENLSLEARCALLGTPVEEGEAEPNWDAYDEAMEKFFHESLPKLRNLGYEVAKTIMSNYGTGLVIEGRAAFGYKDKKDLIPLIKKYAEEGGDTEDYETFVKGIFNDASPEERIAFIEERIAARDFIGMEDFIADAGELPHSLAEELLKAGRPGILAAGLGHFAPWFGPEMAQRLIKAGYSDEVAKNLQVFRGLTPEIRNSLESSSYYSVADNNPDAFTRAPSAPGTRRWKPKDE